MAPAARRPLARALHAVALAGTLAGTTACSVISPVPLWEVTKAAGAVAAAALPYAPTGARNTVHHGQGPVRAVCIEFNPQTAAADLLPALQQELRSHRVDSRVYDSAGSAPACATWLRYSAQVDWAAPPFEGGWRAHVVQAELSLHDARGGLLSSSQYVADDLLGRGKWASTRRKLAPVVTALLTGFED